MGAEVARRHGLAVGASLTGAHGLAAAGPAHDGASVSRGRHPRALRDGGRPPRAHVGRERVARPRGARPAEARDHGAARPLRHAACRRHAAARDQREHRDAGRLARLRERAAPGSRGRRRRHPAVVRRRAHGERRALPLRRAHLRPAGAPLRPRPAAHPRREARVARGADAGRGRDAAGGGRYTGPRSRAWRDARAGTVARRGGLVAAHGACVGRRGGGARRRGPRDRSAHLPRSRGAGLLQRSREPPREDDKQRTHGAFRTDSTHPDGSPRRAGRGRGAGAPAPGSRQVPGAGRLLDRRGSRAGRHGPLAAPPVRRRRSRSPTRNSALPSRRK